MVQINVRITNKRIGAQSKIVIPQLQPVTSNTGNACRNAWAHHSDRIYAEGEKLQLTGWVTPQLCDRILTFCVGNNAPKSYYKAIIDGQTLAVEVKRVER